jgi:tetratricopeptide (TPR) repeat protein
MGKYVVAVFSDLCKHSQAWNRIPKDQMAGLVGEYKALAEKAASQHGSTHANFTGDGHLFLFENADAAVRFGLSVISGWHDAFETIPALQGVPPIPLRVGAHFGEDTEIGNGEAWVGRANNVAKRIEEAADPDSLFVSEGILDLIDFPLYHVQPVAPCKLEDDCVARRTLYRVDSFDEAASAAKPPGEVTPEEWFLRGVAMIGTAKENTDEEEACYQEALRLRPDLANAHYNYAVLLQERGDPEGAEEHYLKALRLRPDDADAHNNYGVLLKEKGDAEGAEEHYQEALRLRPDDAEAHNNYANLLKEKGDVESAEGHYKKALAARPDYATAHYNYAILLRQQGHPRKAKRHYEQAFQFAPDDPDIKAAYERRAWGK